MGISAESVISKTDNFIETDTGDQTVLMLLEDGDFLGLSETGRRIWELIETPQTFSDICSVLTHEFAVKPDDCKAATIEFLSDLAARALIDVDNATDQ